MIISEPFIKCPFCGKRRYGVLSVSPRSYARRCEVCFNPGGLGHQFPLPPCTKKVVYLDQNIISNMMKATNPGTKANKDRKIPPIWKEIFVQMDRVCKLQLAVCPASDLHDEESSLCCLQPELKDVYEYFSTGVSFLTYEQVRSEQLAEYALVWRGKKEARRPDIERVTEGHVHGWQPRFRVAVNFRPFSMLTEETTKTREKERQDFTTLFRKWQAEKGLTFQIELNRQFDGIRCGLDFARHAIAIELERSGDDPESCPRLADEFLREVDLRNLPTENLGASLFAALAAKASSNPRMKPPQGVVSADISIISQTLPYCDSIFVDNFFGALLNEKPLKEIISGDVQIFSTRTVEPFLEYLRDIESMAGKDHIRLVEEVYGKGWMTTHSRVRSFGERS